MAAAIEAGTGQSVDVTPGERGEFTIRVDGAVVATKSRVTGFPDDAACVAAVQDALG